MAEPTQIRHVIIEHAGLLDANEMKYTPGLTIDYNYLKITGLIVRKSVSDGVNVKYSHPLKAVNLFLKETNLENSLSVPLHIYSLLFFCVDWKMKMAAKA